MQEKLLDSGNGYTWLATSNVNSVTIPLPTWATTRGISLRAVGRLKHGLIAGTNSVLFRPNGLTTNQNAASSVWFAGGGNLVSANATVLRVASPSEEVHIATAFEMEFDIETTGSKRSFKAESRSWTSTTPRAERRTIDGGFWDDESTPLTSLQFIIDTAGSNMNTGSHIRVYVRMPSAGSYISIP